MERNAVALQLALQQWVLGSVIGAIGVVTASAAHAAPLEEFQYNPQTDQLSFVLPDGVTPRYFLMAQPARIVVDIPDTQIGDLPLEQTFAGAVKRVEVTQVQPQLARVILEMSPQAMFARGQVSLQNVGDAAPQKDRWMLKPLLASPLRPGTPTAIAPTQPAVNLPANPMVVTPPAPIVAAKPAPAVELPPGMESVIGAPAPLPKLATILTAPVVNQPPVVVPPAAAVPIARLSEVASLPDVPPPRLLQATIIHRAPTNPNSPAALITPSPVIRSDRQPSIGGSSPLVSVPPLASIGVPAVTLPSAAATNLPPAPPLPGAVAVAPTLPTLLLGTEPGGAGNTGELPPLPDGSLRGSGPTVIAPAPTPVRIAALPPTASLSPTALPVAPSPQLPATGVVEFGQRLPGVAAAVAPNLPTLPNGAYVVALDNLTTGGVVVPAGTMLSLRYDQPTALKLKSGQRQQSLFSLQSPIVDSQGRVLAMQGSSVLGEFATSGEGSQFTTQVLAIGNRSLALTAQSDMLKSTKRLSGDRLLQNSGIGAVAGAILGGLNGSVLGGAAAGAAITYAIAPKDRTLQPGQVLQVKLMQDFFAAR